MDKCPYNPELGLQMSRKRNGAISFIAFGLLATLWLFVGIYRSREWQELRPFIKYRPSLKVYFYTPLGGADQSDKPGHEGYLTDEQQREEKAFVEFVEKNWLKRLNRTEWHAGDSH